MLVLEVNEYMQKILQSSFISSIYSVRRKLDNIIFKTFVQVRVFSGLSFFIGGVRRRPFHNDVQIACDTHRRKIKASDAKR